VKFEQVRQQIVFQEYVDTVATLSNRLDAEWAGRLSSTCRGRIGVLAGERSANGITRGEFTHRRDHCGRDWRLKALCQRAAADGLSGVVPSERSSGPKQTRGGITKTGNGHVRRKLVQAAFTYRRPARKTAVLQRRAERTSEVVQEIAWKAQKRLCACYRNLVARGKLKVQACTAIARKLAGFIWAIGQVTPQPAAKA
jgi:transposase